MSTRCQIGFYPTKKDAQKDKNNWVALLYRHSDGYPTETLADLIDFCRFFQQKRGMHDLEYCAARALIFLMYSQNCLLEYSSRSSISFSGSETIDHYSHWDSRSEFLREMGILGYGISHTFHSDLEYFYAVTGDGHILAFSGYGSPTDLRQFFQVDISSVLKQEISTNALVNEATVEEKNLEEASPF